MIPLYDSHTSGRTPWVTRAIIAANLIFLNAFGENVKARLGHVVYLAFYLVCGVAASLAQALSTPADSLDIPCLGASGAIAGVMGA
ncbi:rhomboid family intramembrane serine protease [Candidatus Sumerlaeota bacterium]|nr:rhomboid family intramembrane serine protease [Candidatus Sumerlaeota bacterium]MBI3737030.1 rhomboid family intramembrane serine protease [Candidatus Sumerlaeota bacterium]